MTIDPMEMGEVATLTAADLARIDASVSAAVHGPYVAPNTLPGAPYRPQSRDEFRAFDTICGLR